MQVNDKTITESILFNATNRPTEFEKCQIIDFLHHELNSEEHSKQDIRKAIEYSTKEKTSFGGFTMVERIHKQIVGVAVINQTGMEGYIPENVLVYIATESNYRRQGIATRLLDQIIRHAKGDISLSVSDSCDAKCLYEKYGFTSNRIEMRLKRG